MSRLCRKYMSEVRTLFPIKRKQERVYLKTLASAIEEFCEDRLITSKQELYENYGTPYEVMTGYFATINTDHVVKKLRVSKAIRRAVMIILLLATFATTVYCIHMLESFVVFKQEGTIVNDTYNVTNNVIQEEF